MTIYDVARLADVRPGTVSKAERGGPVSAKLAARLVAAVGGGLTEEMVLYPERFRELTGAEDSRHPHCAGVRERRVEDRRQAERRVADRREK